MKILSKNLLITFSFVFMFLSGCLSTDEILKKYKIWNEKSEKIEIVQYSGQIQSNEHRVELYANSKTNLLDAALKKLNTTYAFDNLQGMSCATDAITYRVSVFGQNNSLSEFYSANTYCDSTEGKKFISVVKIEKLIKVLEN